MLSSNSQKHLPEIKKHWSTEQSLSLVLVGMSHVLVGLLHALISMPHDLVGMYVLHFACILVFVYLFVCFCFSFVNEWSSPFSQQLSK